MAEKNKFSKRLKRYASVSGRLAAAGVRMASPTQGREGRAVVLRAALGGLKGPLMKVAQILGTIPDLVPPEYATEFAKLQADAPSMGWPFVKRRMSAELGADWERKFASFEPLSAAAASLGQVHRAKAKDGTVLACKLQYPDMASVVEADLRQLKILLSLYESFDRSVMTDEVFKEVADRLREELDYAREAKHMRLFGFLLKDEDGVHVPSVIDKLSTDRLLTQTWLSGESLIECAKKRSLNDRNRIAMNLHRAWYVPFYKAGVIHGDPHLGNYTVCEDNGINLLDFGCVRIFDPKIVQSVIMLYESLRDGDKEKSIEAYRAWGFSNMSKALVDILNIWAGFIYAPLLEDKKRPVSETNTGVYGKETAKKVHDALRKIGGVTIPREFVFMDRAAVGLGSVFLRLNAEINWHRIFEELIYGNDVKKLRLDQHELLKKFRLN
jgi:predicted unusual protein kinase regulating ubiquinone biosynthesis (AarF/ABC1/UbiB family)